MTGAPASSPPVVHQAVGMTMEYLNCSAVDAYEALCEQAAILGAHILHVADDVVERRFRFD